MDKLFDTKRKYTGYDGEEYIDLCIPVVDVNNIAIHSFGTLSQDDNGRLDNFVWKDVSKNIDAIDLVMYANHIFNPFSVQDGDIINIPTDNDGLYVASGEPTLPDGSKHSNTSNGKKTRTYAENVEYIAKQVLGRK